MKSATKVVPIIAVEPTLERSVEREKLAQAITALAQAQERERAVVAAIEHLNGVYYKRIGERDRLEEQLALARVDAPLKAKRIEQSIAGVEAELTELREQRGAHEGELKNASAAVNWCKSRRDEYVRSVVGSDPAARAAVDRLIKMRKEVAALMSALWYVASNIDHGTGITVQSGILSDDSSPQTAAVKQWIATLASDADAAAPDLFERGSR